LESESDYPDKGVDGKCSLDKSEIKVNINGSLKISSNEDGKKREKVIEH
jgi:hypothetical protein